MPVGKHAGVKYKDDMKASVEPLIYQDNWVDKNFP